MTELEVFAALDSAGITKVECSYAGSGDDGQFEPPCCYDAAGREVYVDDPLDGELENMLWEVGAVRGEISFDNEGSTGVAVIDVPARLIHYDHSWYIEQTEPAPFAYKLVVGDDGVGWDRIPVEATVTRKFAVCLNTSRDDLYPDEFWITVVEAESADAAELIAEESTPHTAVVCTTEVT